MIFADDSSFTTVLMSDGKRGRPQTQCIAMTIITAAKIHAPARRDESFFTPESAASGKLLV
jgi:hypothetical protein